MNSQPLGWTFNGDAAYDGVALSALLTPDASGKHGSVIFSHSVITDSFNVSFDFRLGSNAAGGDGMAFFITTSGAGALGANLGVTGLAGYGFELDTYNDGVPSCSENDGNHVAVDSLQQCGGSPIPNTLKLGAPPGQAFEDGGWHSCAIAVANGVVSSFVVNGAALITNFSIPGWVAGTSYWYGFAASTSSATNRQEIRNVQLTFPTPRCL